jgi:hypothetical protein
MSQDGLRGARSRRTASEKVERDRQIVSDRLKGLSWSQIAESHGLRERQARNIFSEWQKSGAARLESEDPAEVVFGLIERYRQVELDLALVAADADNSAAQVGAHRARLDAIDRQVELMQASGLLPRHLGDIQVGAEIQMVAARIVTVFRDHGVPQEATRAVITALSGEGS